MMILDTDHVSVLRYPEDVRHDLLKTRMENAFDDSVTTVITLEEQSRGWLAAIKRTKDVRKQPLYYTRLAGMVEFFADWELLPFDEPAADQFHALRRSKVRIGTMDLKIASIALVHGAMLLSADLRDFDKVPGLTVEDWLH